MSCRNSASFVVFVLLFVALSSLLGCVGSLIFGHLVPGIGFFSLVLGAGFSIALARRQSLFFSPPPVSGLIGFFYLIVAIGIFFHSYLLVFQKGDDFWVLNPFNHGDLSFHWGVIRYLARGANFWPENPLFAGARFKYSFGVDFFNAFFENLGVQMSVHLRLVTFILLGLTFYTLHLAGGPFLVFAVFFSGGFYDILQGNFRDLTLLQGGVDFKNLFLTVLMTQRGFLFAIPAGVYLVSAFYRIYAGRWQPGLVDKVILGLIWGSLGFFHLHSFFFLSFFLGLLAICHRSLKQHLLTVSIAALIGLPFVLNALWPETSTIPVVSWNWLGWTRLEGESYVIYWLKNFGPWLVAMLTALTVFFRKKQRIPFVGVSLALLSFALFAHLMLAPWSWDNIKLLLWCYLVGLMAILDWLWVQRSRVVKLVLFLIFFTPGIFVFLVSLPPINVGNPWVSLKSLQITESVLAGHDVNEGILVRPINAHPVFLQGFKVYMGYPGQLWSHGYEYSSREASMTAVYSGDAQALELIPKEQVKLIYLGPLEKELSQGRWTESHLNRVKTLEEHELFAR